MYGKELFTAGMDENETFTPAIDETNIYPWDTCAKNKHLLQGKKETFREEYIFNNNKGDPKP